MHYIIRISKDFVGVEGMGIFGSKVKYMSSYDLQNFKIETTSDKDEAQKIMTESKAKKVLKDLKKGSTPDSVSFVIEKCKGNGSQVQRSDSEIII